MEFERIAPSNATPVDLGGFMDNPAWPKLKWDWCDEMCIYYFNIARITTATILNP